MELLGAVIRVRVAPDVAALIPEVVSSLIVKTELPTGHHMKHKIVNELLLGAELF